MVSKNFDNDQEGAPEVMENEDRSGDAQTMNNENREGSEKHQIKRN